MSEARRKKRCSQMLRARFAVENVRWRAYGKGGKSKEVEGHVMFLNKRGWCAWDCRGDGRC